MTYRKWNNVISHCDVYRKRNDRYVWVHTVGSPTKLVDPSLAEEIWNAEQSESTEPILVTVHNGTYVKYEPRIRRHFPPMTEENIRLNAEYKSITNKLARKMWRECHVKNQYGRWECLDGIEHDWTGEADEVIRDRNYYPSLDSYMTDMIERHEEEEEVRKHEVLEKFGIDLDEVDPNF